MGHVINIEKNSPAITPSMFKNDAIIKRIEENSKLHDEYIGLVCKQLNNMDTVHAPDNWYGHTNLGSPTNVILGWIIMGYSFAYDKGLEPIMIINNRTHWLRIGNHKLHDFNPVNKFDDALSLINEVAEHHKSSYFLKSYISGDKIKYTINVGEPKDIWKSRVGNFKGCVSATFNKDASLTEMICKTMLKLLVKNDLFKIKTNKRKVVSSEFKDYYQTHNHESKEAMIKFIMDQK